MQLTSEQKLRNPTAESYRQVFARRSPSELRALAQAKRFLERYQGDQEFRRRLREGPGDPQGLANSYGIDINPEQALPLFRREHRQFRFTQAEEQWPLAKLWDDYLMDMFGLRSVSQIGADCGNKSPLFHSWRQRQIARCSSELGPVAGDITHPIFAFELSAGCSIGCAFCGVSAGRLVGNFAYTRENAKLWRGVLGEAVHLFGTAAQQGFCYWATDPADNVDYPRFIEDYHVLTGNLPQTTTAAPLRNLEWTRSVLALSEKYRCISNRFSILSLGMLNRVHATFSAEELLGVELILQNKEALSNRAAAGRARDQEKPSQANAEVDNDEMPAYSTIACVSGFLVNMVDKTVQLVSPTAASDRWPLGYKIFGRGSFTSPDTFRAAVEGLISSHMPSGLAPDDMLRFRDDLAYESTTSGFRLRSPSKEYVFEGFGGATTLGELIDDGHSAVSEVQAAMTDSGENIFLVASVLQNLFERGLLNDDASRGGIGSSLPAVGGS